MEDIESSQFGIWDFLIFSFTLAMSMAIGLYFAYADRKDSSTANYMFGNRKMPAFAVAMSMAITFMSATSIISIPAEVYLYGNSILWGSLGGFLGIIFTSHYYIPFYHRLQVKSIFELVEFRFNRKLRLFSSFFLNTQYLLYLGIALYSSSLALSAVTPISLEWSVALTSLICTIYTTMGGMKAVIWTDFLQGFIMFFGSLAVLIKLSIMQGGFGEVWAANERGRRNNLLSMDFDPRVHASMPVVVVGFFVMTVQSSISVQPVVQRYISCKNVKQAKISNYWRALIGTTLTVVIIFNGMAMYAFYEGCDPVKTKEIIKTDQALPLLVVKIFKDLPGFAGLFVAATYSATLSTVSSGVNSIATIVLHDGVLVFWPNTSKRAHLPISRLSSVVAGVLIFVVAILAKFTQGTVLQLAFILFGTSLGPSLALFLYVFIPCVNTKGAIVSLIVGVMFGTWLAVGMLINGYPDPTIDKKLTLTTEMCDNFTQAIISQSALAHNITAVISQKSALADTFYAISPYMAGAFGCVVTLFIGIVTSVLTGGNKNPNPEYFIPLLSDKRFPPSVVKFFRFGVPELSEYEKDRSLVDGSTERLKVGNEMNSLDNRMDNEVEVNQELRE